MMVKNETTRRVGEGERTTSGLTEAARKPTQTVTLQVNGSEHTLAVEPRRVLLDALRYDLGLTGTKKVCTMGNCGACTVLLDGEAVYSCLVLGVECEGQSVTTIEGISQGNELDPVQAAFIEADAYQCGFCTSGQIMSLKALFNETPAPDDEEILRAVSGNLCRCGAYRNILRAGRLAAESSLESSEHGKGAAHGD